MEYAVYESPAVSAPVDERGSFLRKVSIWTMVGLGTATVSATASALFFATIGASLLSSNLVVMGVFFGCYFAAMYGAGGLIRSSDSPATKAMALIGGSTLQGFSLGILLVFAAAVSAAAFNDPFTLILQALALTGACAVGMTGYLLSGPKDLSAVRAILGVMFLPMICAMFITAVFPINGVLGMGVSALFVVISCLGLLYNLNEVMHNMSTKMHMEAAFSITMGLLILFWNILQLLMTFANRD